MQPNQYLSDFPDEIQSKVEAHLLAHSERDPETGCVNYTGGRTAKGYGRFLIQYGGTNTVRIRAHRAAWILTHGPIPDPTLVIDHLCYNRACVNPEHLELTTNEENLRRAIERRSRLRASKQPKALTTRRPRTPRAPRAPKPKIPVGERSACVHGHPWPQYLHWKTEGGRPRAVCSECRRLYSKAKRPANTVHAACLNCAAPILLRGLRWRHEDTGLVACDPLAPPLGRLVAQPAPG